MPRSGFVNITYPFLPDIDDALVVEGGSFDVRLNPNSSYPDLYLVFSGNGVTNGDFLSDSGLPYPEPIASNQLILRAKGGPVYFNPGMWRIRVAEDGIVDDREQVTLNLYGDNAFTKPLWTNALILGDSTKATPKGSYGLIRANQGVTEGTNLEFSYALAVASSSWERRITSAQPYVVIRTLDDKDVGKDDFPGATASSQRYYSRGPSNWVKASFETKDDGILEGNEYFKIVLYDLGNDPEKLYPVAEHKFYLADSEKNLPKTTPATALQNSFARALLSDKPISGAASFSLNSYDNIFYNLGRFRYGVQQRGKSTIDEITGATTLQFQDQAISLANDVAATFNQVKGIDDVSGVVFRLYNAAFARLPDANGLENWINGNKSGGQTYASSALEFSKSQEFKNRYGSNVSDTQYINTLYNNVLGRTPDPGGLSHYQGLLASGKDRGSLLLDFSESPENRVIFSQVTGLA